MTQEHENSAVSPELVGRISSPCHQVIGLIHFAVSLLRNFGRNTGEGPAQSPPRSKWLCQLSWSESTRIPGGKVNYITY